jgi:hypothetical protein
MKYDYVYSKELYFYIEQVILHYYLIEINYRNLSQIDVYDKFKPYVIDKIKIINDLIIYLNKNNIPNKYVNKKLYIYNLISYI